MKKMIVAFLIGCFFVVGAACAQGSKVDIEDLKVRGIIKEDSKKMVKEKEKVLSVDDVISEKKEEKIIEEVKEIKEKAKAEEVVVKEKANVEEAVEVVSAPVGSFNDIALKAKKKGGVREISYDQFVELRKIVNEDIVVIDVLGETTYEKGHIMDAISMPVYKITKESAGEMLPANAGIIVYCGGFSCDASTAAAKKLDDLGYNVVDYKGGLEEWQKKGNKLSQE